MILCKQNHEYIFKVFIWAKTKGPSTLTRIRSNPYIFWYV